MRFIPFLANVTVSLTQSKKLLGVGGLTIKNLQDETGREIVTPCNLCGLKFQRFRRLPSS